MEPTIFLYIAGGLGIFLLGLIVGGVCGVQAVWIQRSEWIKQYKKYKRAQNEEIV